MAKTKQHDQEVILALEYIKKHPCGYIFNLGKYVDSKIIHEFRIVGILKCGQSENGPIYRFTTFGRNYAAIILQKKHQR